MNIGIDIRSLMDQNRSGVGEYTYNLLKHLFEIDKKNSYFLFYNSFKKIEPSIPKFEYPNVNFCGFSFPNKIFNLSLNIYNSPKIDQLIFKKFKIKLDYFLVPNLNFLSLSTECKKIITVHDLSFALHPEFYSCKRKIWHYIVAVKQFFQDAYKIICVSKNTKQDLQKIYKIPEEKIKIIYSGISSNFKKIKINDFQKQQLQQKYDLPQKFILSLSTLEPRKNISGIIQAFEQVFEQLKDDNLRLIIAGGQGWNYQDIFKLAKESKKRYFIKFLGYINPNDKIYLYNLAQTFVYPSFYEGFGFPPLEAMACETPVVASHNSCFPEILGNAALLVNPYKINEISESIYKILTSQTLNQTLVANGLEQAKKYSWEKTAEQILEIFK